MSIMIKNIDEHPYTGVRKIIGKIKTKTSEEAPYLNGYFNGDSNYVQVNNITRGKIYDVVKVEGHGDVEDITIIDDSGKEKILADFFFKEVE